MTRILVVRRGGLGDTLLMTAALRALRRRHPTAELHFAGVREFVAVLAAHGVVDVARSSEDLPFWSPSRLRPMLARYDLVVGDEAACEHGRIDPTSVRPGEPFALQLARQLGLESAWPQDGWLSPPRPPGDGPVALAPGSGGPSKNWPRERWLSLAERLPRAFEVIIGPAEIERDDPRRWPWPGDGTFVVEEQPTGLVQVLARASGFVGNDSGPTHLAAMLGVPTVAVFAATEPAVWAPAGPHVRVVGAAGCVPTVDEVAQALAMVQGRRGNRA